jgi:hypothetical protein
VTFKDLRKRVSLAPQQGILFERLQNKPFWIWGKQQHKQEDIRTDGDCCFNHIFGLPQKDGNDKPLYDYEQAIFDSLVTSQVFVIMIITLASKNLRGCIKSETLNQ